MTTMVIVDVSQRERKMNEEEESRKEIWTHTELLIFLRCINHFIGHSPIQVNQVNETCLHTS